MKGAARARLPRGSARGYPWTGDVKEHARAAYRWAEPENVRCVTVGFRCAASPR